MIDSSPNKPSFMSYRGRARRRTCWFATLQRKFIIVVSLAVLSLIASGWVGIDNLRKRQGTQSLDKGKSGAFADLPENEREELVWMAKAANAAYPGVSKPLGFRSFSFEEWEVCADGCNELVYTMDGYFNVGSSGLRGRLMVDMLSDDRVILALSGCDLDRSTIVEGVKDLGQCLSHYLRFSAKQYEQALQLMEGVLSSKPRSQLWIVGHSLGGSLTTYLALHLPDSRTDVRCATFNGYGLSPMFRHKGEKESLASSRLRNVYCDGDPVYNNRLSPGARHFGPSYSLKCEGNWLVQHSIDNMLKLMIAKRSRWPGL